MIVALALAGLMVAGCRVNHTPLRASGERSGNGQPNAVNGAITAVGLFGGAQVEVKNYPNLCAGRATLNGGSAEIKDSCFSGDTNVGDLHRRHERQCRAMHSGKWRALDRRFRQRCDRIRAR